MNSAISRRRISISLNTECGIEPTAIRSTLTPGTITLTATREGLTPATVQLESKPVEIIGGIMLALPPTLSGPRDAGKRTRRPCLITSATG